MASDPKVWEQHPNKDRYKREVFENFSTGAMESKGAFQNYGRKLPEMYWEAAVIMILMKRTIIFSSDILSTEQNHGEKALIPKVKKLMLDYIFQFVDKVHFHIGKENFRSQTALERLGGQKK